MTSTGTALAAPRRALLVLGMHRSGTSALARAAMLCGAAGPATPMPPRADNPGGFWESQIIADLNDEILAAVGSSWNDWVGLDPARLAARGARFQARMAAALAGEFGTAALFALKDPRLCRTLPLWESVFAAEGITPAGLIALRHPVAVARSLARRNGFSLERGLLLWLRHMLEAERRTRGWKRAFVPYDALLADGPGVLARAAARLGFSWPLPETQRAPALGGFLDARQRHETADDAVFGSAYAEVWVRHAWEAFGALERGGDEAAAAAVLDRVGAQFEDACRLFAPAIRDGVRRARPDLRSVTLCAADSLCPDLTARSLAGAEQKCDFADAIFFSDASPRGPFRVQKIKKIESRAAYCAFMLRELAPHVRTSHALVVQWDGMVADPAAWDPAFLDYDYIGARWGRHADGMDVGNGGFSLRSRRLLEVLRGPAFVADPAIPEDVLICRVWRPVLERDHGMRFAPPGIAARFAYERVLPQGPTFGFHGLFNFWRHHDDAALAAIAPLLPASVLRGREFTELVALCFTEGRPDSVRALGAAWRAHHGQDRQALDAVRAALARLLRHDAALAQCLHWVGV